MSVVGALAITKAGITPRESILRWLISALVAGILVNTQEGKKSLYLLVASVVASLGLVGTLLWLAFFR